MNINFILYGKSACVHHYVCAHHMHVVYIVFGLVGAIGMSGLWYEHIYQYNLMDVACLGNETNILDCSYQRIFISSSSCSSTFSVICQQGK